MRSDTHSETQRREDVEVSYVDHLNELSAKNQQAYNSMFERLREAREAYSRQIAENAS